MVFRRQKQGEYNQHAREESAGAAFFVSLFPGLMKKRRNGTEDQSEEEADGKSGMLLQKKGQPDWPRQESRSHIREKPETEPEDGFSDRRPDQLRIP